MSKSKDRFFWKITDDTDWESFQNNLESSFTADWANKNNDINTLWSFWKTKVNGAAESVIRKIPRVKIYRNLWDKDLNKLLKARQDVNKVQRIHKKSYCHDSDLGKRISGLYRKRKEKLPKLSNRKSFKIK
jgi:hypothetical protein